MYRGLLLSGVAGVGKTTISTAIGRTLGAAGKVTALVDTDALAQFGPALEGKPQVERRAFYDRMKCVNLSSVWTNYKAFGAHFIVVAGGIDSLTLREQYATSLTGCEVKLCRLVAPTATVRQRLHNREEGARTERLLATLTRQEAQFDAAAIEDFFVINDRSATEVAWEILVKAGWVDPLESGPTAPQVG
ncbi:AAA family ATPase [Phytoactinopolyspora alkaliphila]|uniref:AAA family ATPase n=1 Tax=Phytoactinopolyspora alkaliphila TaxID=1783498 RepID=A0A6N9YH10_9ACTN|nr:AAA family ATPase [Phytoactinopolyspora alkaliphila]NED94169.1 AAA family ATPase [Phytoactinopolyspora alkaliphila]